MVTPNTQTVDINDTDVLHLNLNFTPPSETIVVSSTIGFGNLNLQPGVTNLTIHFDEAVDITQTILHQIVFQGVTYQSYNNINLAVNIDETINVSNFSPSGSIVIDNPITIYDHNMVSPMGPPFPLGFLENGQPTFPSLFDLSNGGALGLAGLTTSPIGGETVDLAGTINLSSPSSNGTFVVDNPISLIGVSLVG